MAASQFQKSWTSDLLGLCESINKTVEEKKASVINMEQCFVVKLLANYIKRYVNQWINICGEENWWDLSKEAGKELHTVLERGLQLISLCGEKSSPDIAFAILGCKGELHEIIDDARVYAQMINRSILHFLNSLPRQAVLKLMLDVESDCRSLQSTLETAYEVDKNTPINSSEFQPLALASSSLLRMLLSPSEPNISDIDLSATIKWLGHGSFGYVGEAEWDKLHVAVKSFDYDDYFKEELTIYKKLLDADSPHIVRMLGYSTSNKLVLELMEKDMRELIMGLNCPLPLIQSLDVMLQIAKAMRHLHSINVVHRDLKPANVLLKSRTDESLLIKLTDFGVSKGLFKTDMNTNKRGTWLYMAPEMKKGDSERNFYSRKVDVYSFGWICSEILTGKLRKEVGEKLDLPRNIPKKLASLISSCKEENAAKRPSFEDICSSLWLVKEEVLTKVTDTEAMELKLTIRGLRGIRWIDFTGKRAIHVIRDPMHIRRLRDIPADTLFDVLFNPPHYPLSASGQLKLDVPQSLHRANLPQVIQQFQTLVRDQENKSNLYFKIRDWSGDFSAACSTAGTRATLVNSVVELLKDHPIFKGLVFDCFYYTEGKIKNVDVDNLVLTLEALRKELPVGSITIAITSMLHAANQWQIEKAVHLVDQVHLVLPYQDKITAHVSALYPNSFSKHPSIDEVVKLYGQKRVPFSKLFIKGELFSYKYAETDGLGSPARNADWDLPYKELPPGGSKESWDDEAKAAYVHDPNRRVFYSYDNSESMVEKAEYIKKTDLGGIVVYYPHADFSYDHERSAIKALHCHLTHG